MEEKHIFKIKQKQNYGYDAYEQVFFFSSKKDIFLVMQNMRSRGKQNHVLIVKRDNYVWDKNTNENHFFYKSGKLKWQLYNGKLIKTT